MHKPKYNIDFKVVFNIFCCCLIYLNDINLLFLHDKIMIKYVNSQFIFLNAQLDTLKDN